MNNDSTPSEPAAPPLEPTTTTSEDPAGDTAAERARIEAALTPKQKRAQAQTKKRYEFINSMMLNLDMIVYVELCIVYYMDCSFFRLLLRTINQLVFLTPKPAFLPPLPQHRPYVGAILLPNLICILLHIFTARSEAGEAMRGYLHGGVIIDLIGQKGPTSKIHLLLLDFLILGLQCFMLTVHVERERLTAALAAFLKPAATGESVAREGISTQDQDAEERGIRRIGRAEASQMPDFQEGGSSNSRASLDVERARLLSEPTPQEEHEDDDYPLDIFWAGTAIVADFHILHTLRRQWADYGSASASALQTVGFSAGFVTTSANRRFNAATQRLQRGVESMTV